MEKNKIENLLFKIDDDIELGKDDKEIINLDIIVNIIILKLIKRVN